MRINNIYILTLALTLIVLSGCKSKKLGNETTTLSGKTQNELIDDLLSKEVKYKTIYTKGNIELKSESGSTKLSAQYRIIKDSVIQVSILMPIIRSEAARIIFTPDNLIILDRWNKRYVEEDISELKSLIQFNYANLQALLTNRLFVSGANDVTKDDYNKYKLHSTDQVHQLQAIDKDKLIYNFAIDGADRIVSTYIKSQKAGFDLQWSYSNFVNDNDQTYPLQMDLKADVMKAKLNIGIEYSKLEIDKGVNVDTSIPGKYKKVSLKEFIGSFVKTKSK